MSVRKHKNNGKTISKMKCVRDGFDFLILKIMLSDGTQYSETNQAREHNCAASEVFLERF